MCYLIVFILCIVTSCLCQDTMTCSRTSDTFQLPSTNYPPPTSSIVARPGKRGAKGIKGDMGQKGAIGRPGFKGESGMQNNLKISALEGRIADLERELTNLRQGIMNTSIGWYNGLNGYQYRLTPQTQNWGESRTVCQGLGGDLAVAGVQGNLRVKIFQNIGGTKLRTWVGLSDMAREGQFLWIDGTLSTAANTPWRKPNEPNGGRDENCVHTLEDEPYSHKFNDIICSTAYRGLCEKPIGM